MPLSCECPDLEAGGWWYEAPDDYTPLQTPKRKRCSSCKVLIDRDTPVLRFLRWRSPKDDIEERIHGGEDSEIRMSDLSLCEKCGDQYMNLSELGFCIDPTEDIFELLAEYRETYRHNKILTLSCKEDKG